MLCGRDESGERVLAQEGWIFELKLDGVRIIADKRRDRVSLGYRKIRDATSSYPEIAEAVAKLGEERVVLDGEIVAFDAEGKPDFQRLGTRIQTRGRGAKSAAHSVPVAYVVFDVLVVGDYDLTGLPIEARKAILEEILGETSQKGGHLRLHPTFTNGTDLFRLCREHQLEGVVAKRASSTYRPDDRSSEWVKIKCELDADLVVIGFTEGEGRRSRLGALDLGAYDGDRLIVRGSVGSGLDEDTIDVLVDRLMALEVPRPVAEGVYLPKRGRRHVKPEIVVSVRYMGLSTGDKLMRHPVFRGVRHDLDPRDCTVAPVERGEGGERRRMRTSAPSTVVLPDGTTKSALCRYYEAVAPALLPHVRGRICPLLRADARPQSAMPTWTPRWIRTAVARSGKNEVRGVVVEDVETLRFLVEAGCASLSMSPFREDAPGKADFVGLRIEGESAARVALRARDIVAEAGLTAFVKVATAASFDVVVPVGRAPAEATDVLAALFARMLAPYAERAGVNVREVEFPIAPYGVIVPLAGGRRASASLPVAWDELDGDVAAMTTLDRVQQGIAGGAQDPMGEMLSVPANFANAVVAIEKMIASGGFGGAP